MQADKVEDKKDLSLSSGKDGIVELWTKELENASEHEKNWRNEASKNFEIYKDEYNNTQGESKRYNVFWSNTQTLKPLVFSKLPNPNITQRFPDENEVAKLASEMMERSIDLYLNDSNTDVVIGKCRDDLLIGGRGVARICYDPEDVIEVGEEKEEIIDASTKKCRIDYVDWRDFRMSPANEWSKVRWVAFRHYKTRDELVEDYGNIGKTVSLNKSRLDCLENNSNDDNNDLLKVAEVWEIWDKETRKVYFVTCGGDGKLLSEEEDPYNLKGFFPMPAPLGSSANPNTLLPIPLYRYYKSQAEELNSVDERIKSLIKQCRFTGVYNSIAEVSDIEALFNGEDGSFQPLKGTGGLQKASDMVMFKPLNELIATIRELQNHKVEILNSIRDITGISDIVRGVSIASETATAQNIKSNFAISRIQPIQKEVEYWSRDLIRLESELIIENYSIDELIEMTNLKVIDINKIAQDARDRLRLLMIEAEAQIDPNDPEAQQKMEILKQQAEKGFKETLKQPLQELKGYAATPEQLAELTKMVKDDKMRTFNISVETDSTIRIDQQQEKQERVEYITAISNFSNAFFPLTQAGIITPEAFQQLMMFISKPFKVGRTVEEALTNKEEETKEKQPSAAEMLAQAQIELEQQKLQLEAQKQATDAQLKQEEINIKKADQLFQIEKHKDLMEFEDVNKQADREAKRLDMIVAARTQSLNEEIRNANQPTQI